jgi:hypothetical protein
MAASLTYYTTVALAPLMGVFLAAVGLAFGSASARDHLVEAIRLEVGDTGANLIKAVIAHVASPKLSIVGTVIGGLALFFGATGAFIDLKNSLRVIWSVPETDSGGFGSFLLARVISFAMVLITGAIIVVSISVSVSLSTLHHYFGSWMPVVGGGQVADVVLSFMVTAPRCVWSGGNRSSFHCRKGCHRGLYRECQHRLALRSGGLFVCVSDMALLFVPSVLYRSDHHQISNPSGAGRRSATK